MPLLTVLAYYLLNVHILFAGEFILMLLRLRRFKPSTHEQIFCGKFSVKKMFARASRQQMACWKLVYVPEITMDSGDKTEEATANLWVYGKLFVMGGAREQTFAYDIFSFPHGSLVFVQMHLSHKIQANVLMYTNKEK